MSSFGALVLQRKLLSTNIYQDLVQGTSQTYQQESTNAGVGSQFVMQNSPIRNVSLLTPILVR